MRVIESSILARIGNTPLVELKTMVPEGAARVFLKIEGENPTGSMKDRMALAMVEAAERDGRLNPEPLDEIAAVSTEDAMAMARRLAREEGIFAGTSTGANVIVALRAASELGSNRCVVTIMCDSGVKYLSTELYNRTDEADE